VFLNRQEQKQTETGLRA